MAALLNILFSVVLYSWYAILHSINFLRVGRMLTSHSAAQTFLQLLDKQIILSLAWQGHLRRAFAEAASRRQG